MKEYKKLVRDKIPTIIESNGGKPVIRILSDEEYPKCLTKKLQEETQEFVTDGTVEELADIYEVVLAILKQKGVSVEEFEALRKKKATERGGFDDKIFLERVEGE